MLQPLNGLKKTAAWFKRARVESPQLTLELDTSIAAPRDGDELLARLRAFGLKRIEQCRLTRNRNVMVSYRGPRLRIHAGYLDAPEDIHRAIVVFIEGRTRAERRQAQKAIVTFAVDAPAPERPRRERQRPEDEPVAERLRE